MTQKQLATRVGVRTSKVSHWETEFTAVSMKDAPALARALRWSVSKLVRLAA